MNRLTFASTISLATAASWSCADAPVAPDQRTIPPSLAVDQTSSAWSTPKNLGSPVNLTTATEQHPTLSKDGLKLYFASNRDPNGGPGVGDQNIWVAQRACTDSLTGDCVWNQLVKLEAVNSEYLDVSPALSRDEHQLFFSSQRSNEHCTASPDTPCDRDLWVSYRDDLHSDAVWQTPVNLGSSVNTNGEEVAPSYFENDDSGLAQLFFNDGVVNQETGILGMGDIYVSQLTAGGTWEGRSKVDNINTDCSDQRASISYNGRALYFHSTRLTAGTGCAATARIWVATRAQVSDPWSTPTQVLAPISNVQTIHPFIHSLGKTESLLFVRGGDIWISQRTKGNASE